jgi:hypothetical protein
VGADGRGVEADRSIGDAPADHLGRDPGVELGDQLAFDLTQTTVFGPSVMHEAITSRAPGGGITLGG